MNKPENFFEFAGWHLRGEHSGAYSAGAWGSLLSRLPKVQPLPEQYHPYIFDADAWRTGAAKADFIWHQWQLLQDRDHRDEHTPCEHHCPHCGKPY
jgi:hypothetical protein